MNNDRPIHNLHIQESLDRFEATSAISPVLTYLFHRIEQRLTGEPTLLVLDEAWIYLDHPLDDFMRGA